MNRPARAGAAIVLVLLAALPARAETIKVGMAKALANGLVAVGQARGYFAAEGLDLDTVFMPSAQPLAVGVASGSLDVALAGLGAGLYNLAGEGELRIIAAGMHEAPSFNAQAFIASKKAYDAGARSVADFAGHSYALSQMGSAGQYVVNLVAERHGIDIKTIRLMAVQSLGNMLSAVTGGQLDFTALPSTMVVPAAARGDAEIVGWVGDEAPYQVVVVIAGTKTIAERPALIERFLRAYRRAARDYHDAFADASDRRRDGPTAPDTLAILSTLVDLPPAQLENVIPFVDRDARLDVTDVLRQIAWYQAQGMVKPGIGGEIIDRRYAVPLPAE